MGIAFMALSRIVARAVAATLNEYLLGRMKRPYLFIFWLVYRLTTGHHDRYNGINKSGNTTLSARLIGGSNMNTRIVVMNGSKLTEVWHNGAWLVVRVKPAPGAAPGIFPVEC